MELKTVKFTETNSQGVKFNFTLYNLILLCIIFQFTLKRKLKN